MDEIINNLNKASGIHKKIRNDLRGIIKANTKLIDISNFIEKQTRLYSGKDEINSGIAFPPGLSLNNIAAHWAPQKNDMTKLKNSDVLKIDFGVHKNGCIIDSAFTWSRNPIYDMLLESSRDAVYKVIKMIGVDTSISDIGTLVEEIVESYEIEKKGILYPVRPIRNICGHSIKPWVIHGGKYIQNIQNNDNTRIEDNDIIAIEVYTTDGIGKTYMGKNNSHFMLNSCVPKNFRCDLSRRTEEMLYTINNNFKTLPFTQKYLDTISPVRYYDPCLEELYSKGLLKKYPPLIEYDKQSRVAQFEHTLLVTEKNNINFSISDDY